MNCQDISLALDDRDLGALSDAERREIDAHLATCPDCMRDHAIHLRLAATPVPLAPLEMPARIRAVLAQRVVDGGRTRSRIIRFGVLVALAAAAALLMMRPAQTPTPSGAVASTEVSPAPMIETAHPVIADTPPVVATPVAEPIPPKVEALTVLVTPPQNVATDAASRLAVDSFLAAALEQLRAVPGLILVMQDMPAVYPPPSISYHIMLKGDGPRSGNKFRGSAEVRKFAVDGSLNAVLGMLLDGDIAPPCAGSAVPDGAIVDPPVCADSANVAAVLVGRIRKAILPADASLQLQLQARLHDSTLEPALRLATLRNLGVGKKDPAVIRDAIKLATTNTDPAVRAEVWRVMRQVRAPELVDPLIAALRQDVDGNVRAEAVETLIVDFADQPSVRAALEIAASGDTNPLVRALAQRTLTGDAVWKDYVITSLENRSLPDSERVKALLLSVSEYGLTTDVSRLFASQESLQALAEVLPKAAGSFPNGYWAMFMVAGQLRAVDHPVVADMMLAYLNQQNPGPMIANILSISGNDPRVRAAIEKISTNDPDPETRAMAASALKRADAAKAAGGNQSPTR